ncbi:MAG TPA: PIN domain-containing protein [Stellaceae bacterium]|jgi:predicted nucleic acid-binding protein|nr:PIN domain-containing protein [Stellaceae bacterium]
MPASFFDTNVLVYLASDPAKAGRARELLAHGGTISVQVLNEIANVTQRKLRFSWLETREFLSLICSFLSVIPITLRIHESGLGLAERYGLSVYDAMIAAAALDSRCDTLWSEDMHDGLVISGRLTVVNPFRAL